MSDLIIHKCVLKTSYLTVLLCGESLDTDELTDNDEKVSCAKCLDLIESKSKRFEVVPKSVIFDI